MRRTPLRRPASPEAAQLTQSPRRRSGAQKARPLGTAAEALDDDRALVVQLGEVGGQGRVGRPAEPGVEAAPARGCFGLMKVLDEAAYRLQHTVDAAAEQDIELVVVDTPPRSETTALEVTKVADPVVILEGLPEPASGDPLTPAPARRRGAPSHAAPGSASTPTPATRPSSAAPHDPPLRTPRPTPPADRADAHA